MAGVALLLLLLLRGAEGVCLGGNGAPRACFTPSGDLQSVDGVQVEGAVYLEGCERTVLPPITTNASVVSRARFRCAPNFFHDVSGAEAVVTSSFGVGRTCITWQVEVTSPTPANWSTPITTALSYPNPSLDTLVWAGGPFTSSLPSPSYNPLAPIPLRSTAPHLEAYYGGKMGDVNHQEWRSAPSTILPILTRIAGDRGVSLAQSLEDTPIVAVSRVNPQGWFNFSRQYHRLGGAARVTFTQHLLSHEGCWRPAAGWLTEEYAEYFNPRTSILTAVDIEGGGSYSDLRGAGDMSDQDAASYKKMGYKLNWDSSARFPFHGEWLPTPQDGFAKTWLTCFAHAQGDTHMNEPCMNVSTADLASWYSHQHSLGFRTCVYGNLFEFGWQTEQAISNRSVDCAAPHLDNATQLLCATRRLLELRYGKAVVHSVRDNVYGATNGLVCGGLDGACIMDPHPDLPYLAHLLEMATWSLSQTPASGVCVDRQDWIGTVNPNADDGVTWYPVVPFKLFAPVRALINSWKPAMKAFAEVWHNAKRPVIINDHVNRADLMRDVDGIFAENTDTNNTDYEWAHGLGSAMAALAKPIWLWNHWKPRTVPLREIESALQATLFAGAFPMLPVRNNDHAIGGDCAPHCPYNSLYFDYAPLFAALKGRRWLLTAHAVTVSDGQANAFVTPAGHVVAVVGASANLTKLDLRLPAKADLPHRGTVTHPGGATQDIPLTATQFPTYLRITASVPLTRSAAVVVLH